MIRIVIADDHAIVRGGLKQIFALTSDIVVVSEAAQGSEVIEQWRHVPCDVLLLDLTMPGNSGVDLIRRLHDEKPGRPILVLSMHNEGQIVARVLKAGAAGYVTKDSEPEILIAAVRKVVAGGKFIDPALVERVVFSLGGNSEQAHDSLSERELQVFRMVAAGNALGAIAESLNLSPKTVSTHKRRLMHKLQIDNNADLVRYATRHGLVNP